MQSTFEEKRTNKRYEGVYVEYAFLGMNDDYRYVDIKNCFLRNFSFSGACIYVYESVPENANIYLRLYDPNSSNPIDIIGNVVWNTHAGSAGGPNARLQSNVGIKFLAMNEANKRHLRIVINYLESLIPKRKGKIDYV